MIGVSVSDILKVLDQLPLWKTLREMPKRIAALEERVQALESAVSASALPEALRCPVCREPLAVISENPHQAFGRAGMKTHLVRCPNNHEFRRDYMPGTGYR